MSPSRHEPHAAGGSTHRESLILGQGSVRAGGSLCLVGWHMGGDQGNGRREGIMGYLG